MAFLSSAIKLIESKGNSAIHTICFLHFRFNFNQKWNSFPSFSSPSSCSHSLSSFKFLFPSFRFLSFLFSKIFLKVPDEVFIGVRYLLRFAHAATAGAFTFGGGWRGVACSGADCFHLRRCYFSPPQEA